MCDFLCDRVVRQRSLIRIPLLLELHVSKEHHGRHNTEDGAEILLGHAHDVHGLDGGLVLRCIINSRYGKGAIGQEGVGLGVLEDELGAVLGSGSGEQLVEDVESSLILGLADGSRLLQEIGLNIGAGDVARGIKVDSDEFTLEFNFFYFQISHFLMIH